MAAPKPITLTQIESGAYDSDYAPEPFVIVGGDVLGIDPQPAIADLAGGADLATTVTKVNAILAALRSAGVIAS